MDAAQRTPVGPAVYYDGSLAIRLLRLVLAVAQRAAPGFAAALAQRLFCTPWPPRRLRHRRAWDAAWQAQSWPFEQASLTLYMPAVAAPAPVALLVHGWGGHAGQMVPLAQALAQQGLRPVLLELPAHGASAGATSTLPQFARAIEYALARLAAEGAQVRVLAGHSLGANAAAFAAGRGAAVQRLVLLAPPASPREYTRYFAQVFGLAEAIRLAMQLRIEAREAALMAQFEPDAVGARVRVPTLLVHDRDDTVNRPEDGEAYARCIPGAELLVTQGLGHRRILQDAQVAARVAAFAA